MIWPLSQQPTNLMITKLFSPFFFLFFSIILMSIGQILFKYTSQKINFDGLQSLPLLLVNKFFILSMVVYFIATLTWIFCMKKFNVSFILPFTAVPAVLVSLYGYYFFDDKLSIYFFLGMAFIFIGLYFIYLNYQSVI